MRHTGPSAEVREAVARRASYRCERCGMNPYMKRGSAWHHRQPRKMGGTARPEANAPSNLLYVCSVCHEWIESNRLEAYDAGWLVREPTDPTSVPVATPMGSRLLVGDGYEVAS